MTALGSAGKQARSRVILHNAISPFHSECFVANDAKLANAKPSEEAEADASASTYAGTGTTVITAPEIEAEFRRECAGAGMLVDVICVAGPAVAPHANHNQGMHVPGSG